MNGFDINDSARKFLMEQAGFKSEEPETKPETKPINENVKEQEEEQVNEDEGVHLCPMCESELPEDFDDETLLERFTTLYDNLQAISEAMGNEESEEDEETIVEEGEEEESEDEEVEEESETEDEE